MHIYHYNCSSNLSFNCLSHNKEAITYLNQVSKTLKGFKPVVGQSAIDKTLYTIKTELNTLQTTRKEMLEAKAEAHRKAYKKKIEALKVTQAEKKARLKIALSKLDIGDREVLKEFSYKL